MLVYSIGPDMALSSIRGLGITKSWVAALVTQTSMVLVVARPLDSVRLQVATQVTQIPGSHVAFDGSLGMNVTTDPVIGQRDPYMTLGSIPTGYHLRGKQTFLISLQYQQVSMTRVIVVYSRRVPMTVQG